MNRARRRQLDRFDAGRYVIARRRSRRGPELMRLLCKAGEALTVLSFGRAPGGFLRLRGLEEARFMRATSSGELVSLLYGPYASIGWVSLNPHARVLLQGDAHATIVDRKSFVAMLLRGAEER